MRTGISGYESHLTPLFSKIQPVALRQLSGDVTAPAFPQIPSEQSRNHKWSCDSQVKPHVATDIQLQQTALCGVNMNEAHSEECLTQNQFRLDCQKRLRILTDVKEAGR
jgi:hypothetical protein